MNAAQRAALEAEAIASVSLDGCTQSCPACVQKLEHVCGKRPMTVAERELVEAAMEYTASHFGDLNLKMLADAVRAERKEAAK